MALTKVKASVMELKVEQLGFVPDTRTINGHPLREDVMLSTVDTGGLTKSEADDLYIKSTGTTKIAGSLHVTGNIKAAKLTSTGNVRVGGNAEVTGNIKSLSFIQNKTNITAYDTTTTISNIDPDPVPTRGEFNKDEPLEHNY